MNELEKVIEGNIYERHGINIPRTATAVRKYYEARVSEEAIEEMITKYFILHKRFLRNKGRSIIFGEDDSQRLAQSIAKMLEDI